MDRREQSIFDCEDAGESFGRFDSLSCPQCRHEMRIVSLINDAQIVERGQNSSSSRGLTIRCRTMTAIHRSGRCDKRDKESRRGCRMEPFRSLPLREHRRGQGSCRKPLRSEGEGRQCATMSPDIRIAAPHCWTYRTESPLHSGFVGHPPATLEKRVPINQRLSSSGATAASADQTGCAEQRDGAGGGDAECDDAEVRDGHRAGWRRDAGGLVIQDIAAD